MKNIKITKNTDNLSNQHNNNNITPPPPPQHNRHLGKNLVLLIGLLALPLFSQAQTITVNDARTATQSLNTAGASITITAAGSIATTTDNARGINVDTAAINAIVINNGTISTTGLNAFGINSSAADVSITNNGTITTTGVIAYGIYSNGANAIITHSGVITTENDSANGINAIGASTITVRGRISATGTRSFAIQGDGLNANTVHTLNLEGDYDIANGDIDLGDGIDTVNIDGVGAYTGTKTSIVFLNTENIISTDYRVVEMGNDTSRTVTIDGTLPPPTVLLNNNGCTLNASTDKKPFDPTLPLLALLAGGYLLNRKLKFN